jgi:hypothetical protein
VRESEAQPLRDRRGWWSSRLEHTDPSVRMDYLGDRSVLVHRQRATRGYLLIAFGDDCNDMDPAVHANLPAHADADQDGVGAGPLVQVCATTLPPGYATTNTDVCATDPTVTTTPHVTPEMQRGAWVEDDAGGQYWSGLGTAPYTSLNNYMQNMHSDWLRFRQYGFALPTTAKILGIAVRVEHVVTSDDNNMWPVRDHEIRLYHGASRTLVNRASATTWQPITIASFIYGGPSDLWGRTWTPAEINASSFGVGVRVAMFNYPDPNDDLVGAVAQVYGAWTTISYCAQ